MKGKSRHRNLFDNPSKTQFRNVIAKILLEFARSFLAPLFSIFVGKASKKRVDVFYYFIFVGIADDLNAAFLNPFVDSSGICRNTA